MLRNKFLNKANTLIADYVRANYENKHVIPGDCRYNFHCHANAVHDAVKAGHKRIAMVVYVEENAPVIHFINELPTGELQDNTLGYWSKNCIYYFVRWVNESEFDDVFKIHMAFRDTLKRLLPWYLLKYSKFDC